MNKLKKTYWKHFRLTLLFATLVFFILLVTMALVFLGMTLLTHLGYRNNAEFAHIPFFAFSIASIIVGTILAILFSNRPLHPIRELMSATDKIADGDYSVRLHLKGPEEFRTLSNKFNHMAEELGSVEMLRSDFINNFSHEFKTPIVSIRGFAKALKWNDLSEAEREEYLDIIISESERLATLSTNVLHLSKLEKQTILTDKKLFNISEQIRLVIVLLDKKLSEKQINIIFDNEEFFVDGNEEMLKQVWINLLDNAIKFSPCGGNVEIHINETAHHTVVTISDEGSGISPEIEAHIFDKFYQGDTSHTTSGNGLGLSIAKKIIDLHNGSITTHSSHTGCTFNVSFKKK